MLQPQVISQSRKKFYLILTNLWPPVYTNTSPEKGITWLSVLPNTHTRGANWVLCLKNNFQKQEIEWKSHGLPRKDSKDTQG